MATSSIISASQFLVLGDGYHTHITGDPNQFYLETAPSDAKRRRSVGDACSVASSDESTLGSDEEFGNSFIRALSDMPYSQGLIDLEQYQSFGNHTEQLNDYFCEDLLSQTTLNQSLEHWQRFPSLPTPPSTPEKRMRYCGTDNRAMEVSSSNEQSNVHQSRSSPSSNLQVVPDSIPEEKVEDILPWLNEFEHAGVVSANDGYFKEYLAANTNQGHSTMCSPKRKHEASAGMLPRMDDIGVEKGMFSRRTLPHASPMGGESTIARFNETPEKPCYRMFEQGAPFTTSSQFHGEHVTTLPLDAAVSPSATTAALASPGMHHVAVPDCILSPVSPTKSMKRSYYQISPMQPQQQQQQRPIMPTSRVARELFPIEFLNNNLPPQEGTGSDSFLTGINPETGHEDIDGSGEGELSRATHNVLERQRRNDLKMRFHILRDNLPDLVSNEKAPKIQILKKAYEHVQELQGHEQRLLADKELERQRKLILLQRLHILRQGFFEF